MDSKDILDNLKLNGQAFSFDILSILKIPVIFLLLGNIFFSILLFLRVRILADTFKTPKNAIVRQIVALHIIMIIVGTLLSLLFVILL